MQAFLIRWLLNVVAILITTRIIPGVRTPDVVGAVVAALILGIVNAIIRPIVLLLTLPLNLITLGLFTLVINTLMLYVVAWIVPQYLQLSGFGAAFLGALLITIISAVLSRVIAGEAMSQETLRRDARPATDIQFLIITGLSGAGKSNAMKVFEDLGFFCVDNLPPALLPKFAELCLSSDGRVRRAALAIDVRGGEFFDDLFTSLAQLEEMGVESQILFLDASDEVLVRRFEETRRKHPLAQ